MERDAGPIRLTVMHLRMASLFERRGNRRAAAHLALAARWNDADPEVAALVAAVRVRDAGNPLTPRGH